MNKQNLMMEQMKKQTNQHVNKQTKETITVYIASILP